MLKKAIEPFLCHRVTQIQIRRSHWPISANIGHVTQMAKADWSSVLNFAFHVVFLSFPCFNSVFFLDFSFVSCPEGKNSTIYLARV